MNWAVCMMTCGVIFLVIGGAIMCWSYIHDEPANMLILLYFCRITTSGWRQSIRTSKSGDTHRMNVCRMYRAEQEEQYRTKDGCKCGECLV